MLVYVINRKKGNTQFAYITKMYYLCIKNEVMKFAELIKKLEKSGCILQRRGANHDIYYSPASGKIFPVGRHHGKEVPNGTLKQILKEAGLK